MAEQRQRIFISYQRNDAGFAEEVWQWLLAHGHRPWMDVHDIPAGAYWPDEIDQALRATDTVLGILSPSSIASRNVKNEWDWAIVNNRRLVLIMSEMCELPFHYVSINYIDFTVDPQRGFRHLDQELNRGLPASAGSAPATARPSTRGLAPSNLPSPPTRLIGRDADLASIIDSFQDTRLVTLTGPGGIGKSRLSIAVASQLSAQIDCPAYFAPLASLTDPALVAMAIAQAIGISESSSGLTVDTVVEHIADQPVVLVADNFEQILAAAPVISELLARCPGLRVLATSRAALRLRGEREYSLSPLPVPAAGEHISLEEAAASPAVTLFVEHARGIRSGFELTAANAAAISEICRRLDGLPLALELAAARTRLFSPDDLLRRLGQRLSVLTGGPRDLPERQQALRTTIAWSYDLLKPAEQALFRRLSVFSGGWTIEAAMTVCASDDLIDFEVIDSLDALLDHSLVRAAEDARGEVRFGMLETIRDYAAEQFAASQAEEAHRYQHAAYFTDYAAQARGELDGDAQDQWLSSLEIEHGNLRAALEWSLTHDVEMAYRLCAALWTFWDRHSHFAEGRRWIARALEAEAEIAPLLRGEVLIGAGTLAWRQGDLLEARPYFEQSLVIFEQAGDRSGPARALSGLGTVCMLLGHYDDAREQIERSIKLQRELGDLPNLVNSLGNLGTVYHLTDELGQAEQLYTEGMKLAERIKKRTAVGIFLSNLGEIAQVREEFDTARAYYSRAAELHRESGNIHRVAYTCRMLGALDCQQGNLSDAEQWLQQAVMLHRQVEAKPQTLVDDLCHVAEVLTRRGVYVAAVRILGAIAAHRERTNLALQPLAAQAHKFATECARSEMSASEFNPAFQAGYDQNVEALAVEFLNMSLGVKPA